MNLTSKYFQSKENLLAKKALATYDFSSSSGTYVLAAILTFETYLNQIGITGLR